jgi:hypothetical protein
VERDPGLQNGLFAGYTPIPGAYDELYGEDGSPRPSSRRVVEILSAVAPALARRSA